MKDQATTTAATTSNNASKDEDEAMEWITDWEYERIPVNPPPPPANTKTNPSPHNNEEDDDDVSMQLDDDPEAPLPISHSDNKEDSHQEMAIFWTRASQEFSPAELQDMFGSTTTKHPEEEDVVPPPPPPPPQDDEDDYMMMMRPLHDDDKEGLLPPMKSPGGNAKYGLIKATASTSTAKHAGLPSFLPLSTASMGTHTTVDLFADGDDSADLLDLDLEGSHHHDVDTDDDPMLWNPELIDRQHEVLQQVLEHGHQARSLQKHATTTTTDDGEEQEDDAIFRRQQEIFQQMRHQDRHATLPTSPSSGYPYPVPSSHNSHGPFQSPVSVVSNGSGGGGTTESYQKQVEDWTQSNILERQRRMLRESMKRTLESRQALHIPPTSLLPQYKNHSKLSKVLQEIESSSHQIFRQTTSYHATPVPSAASNTATTTTETTSS